MKHFVFGRRARALALLTALAGIAASSLAQAQTLSTLMYFNGSRAGGGLTLGTDGALYGVASESQVGGGATAGLLYRVKTDATQVNTVYQYGRLGVFTGGGPRGTLAQDLNGNLYGVTSYTSISPTLGVPIGSGTIFKMTQTGNYTVLYSFSAYTTTTSPFINADGASPNGSLLLASDGFLYGTTVAGGTNGAGTVFKIATDGTGFVSLHSFAASTASNVDTREINADGIQAQTRLLVATNGELYGTTVAGGANGTGVIFRMHRDGTGFTVLLTFDASPDIDTSTGAIKTNTTGGYPVAGLLQASNGLLYGTTSALGAVGYGTLYNIDMNGSGFTVLKNFDLTSGGNPLGELMVANDGTIVGTTSAGATQSGGAAGAGTIYSMSLDGSTLNTLYVFGADGAAPITGVVQTSDGAYFGTTSQGSPYGLGTVYKFGDATNRPPLGTPQPINNGGSISWLLAAALALIALMRTMKRENVIA
jgi:uncharacterized repeat protein (TIGR03803 family)